MSGAEERADYFVRMMTARGSPGKMLSHADGAFHSTPLTYSVPLNTMQQAPKLTYLLSVFLCLNGINFFFLICSNCCLDLSFLLTLDFVYVYVESEFKKIKGITVV